MLGHLGMISLSNHHSSEGEQRGRYNLSTVYVYVVHNYVMSYLLNMICDLFQEIIYIKSCEEFDEVDLDSL